MLHCLPRREFEFSKNVKEHALYTWKKERGFDLCPDSTSLLCFYFEVSLIPRGPVCKFYKRCASKVSMYDSYMRSHTATVLDCTHCAGSSEGSRASSLTAPPHQRESKTNLRAASSSSPFIHLIKEHWRTKARQSKLYFYKTHGLSRGLWEQ